MKFDKDKNKYVTGSGQVIKAIHPETEDCRKSGCSIHAPSDHSMKEWPTHWYAERGMMERVCECGVGHPDPDHIGYIRRTYGDKAAQIESVHGCCGCCASVKMFV